MIDRILRALNGFVSTLAERLAGGASALASLWRDAQGRHRIVPLRAPTTGRARLLREVRRRSWDRRHSR